MDGESAWCIQSNVIFATISRVKIWCFRCDTQLIWFSRFDGVTVAVSHRPKCYCKRCAYFLMNFYSIFSHWNFVRSPSVRCTYLSLPQQSYITSVSSARLVHLYFFFLLTSRTFFHRFSHTSIFQNVNIKSSLCALQIEWRFRRVFFSPFRSSSACRTRIETSVIGKIEPVKRIFWPYATPFSIAFMRIPTFNTNILQQHFQRAILNQCIQVNLFILIPVLLAMLQWPFTFDNLSTI